MSRCRGLSLFQAAPITGSIMLLSGVWYFGGARKMYKGPIGAQNHNPDLVMVQEETHNNSIKEASSA